MNDKKKIMLVTGASSDIGTAMIREVYNEYDGIWAHFSKSEERIQQLKSELGEKILPIQADFANEQEVIKMVENIRADGRVPNNIVHLCAVPTVNQKFHKQIWADYQKGIDVSLRSIVIILQNFIPDMVKQKYGRIVFMLTSYVVGVPPKFQSPYVTVKYAEHGLMKNLASEYADKGITVNAVSPDMIETRYLDNIPHLIVEQNAERMPLKRNLKVDDVVPAFKYLLSDSSEYVNGLNLSITGGTK